MGKLIVTLIAFKDAIVKWLRVVYRVIGEALRLIDKVEKKDDQEPPKA